MFVVCSLPSNRSGHSKLERRTDDAGVLRVRESKREATTRHRSIHNDEPNTYVHDENECDRAHPLPTRRPYCRRYALAFDSILEEAEMVTRDARPSLVFLPN